MLYLAPGENMLQLKHFGLNLKKNLNRKWLFHIEMMISATENARGFRGMFPENILS